MSYYFYTRFTYCLDIISKIGPAGLHHCVIVSICTLGQPHGAGSASSDSMSLRQDLSPTTRADGIAAVVTIDMIAYVSFGLFRAFRIIPTRQLYHVHSGAPHERLATSTARTHQFTPAEYPCCSCTIPMIAKPTHSPFLILWMPHIHVPRCSPISSYRHT